MPLRTFRPHHHRRTTVLYERTLLDVRPTEAANKVSSEILVVQKPRESRPIPHFPAPISLRVVEILMGDNNLLEVGYLHAYLGQCGGEIIILPSYRVGAVFGQVVVRMSQTRAAFAQRAVGDGSDKVRHECPTCGELLFSARTSIDADTAR
jgi:hypothetical protein